MFFTDGCQIVNVNYRGCINQPVDLKDFQNKFVNSKLSKHPFQLTIKDVDSSITLLLFANGNFRLMGCKNDDDYEALCVLYKFTKLIDKGQLPCLILQSMTVKAKYPFHINLYKLSDLIESFLELELFPALTITKYKPVKVNVFATGNIIMCGIRDFDFSKTILQELEPLLCKCTQY